MKITKAKVAHEDGNFITLFFEDGTQGQTTVKDGERRQYTDLYQKWLDDGNKPEVYQTDAEKLAIEDAEKMATAQAYLDNTDYKFTVDKYAQMDDFDKEDLETKREEAREVIRNLA